MAKTEPTQHHFSQQARSSIEVIRFYVERLVLFHLVCLCMCALL